MTASANGQPPPTSGIGAPLRLPVFRRIWLASLLSNLGLLIQNVGAAWSMTEMTSSASMVALVQTATALPLVLISVAAGAIADMYDRRLVSMVATTLTLTSSIALTVLAYFGAITPVILLAFCFLIGCGMALFGPAWQASVSEQVPSHALPAAVALNSVSYNIARSLGPAIGGFIVAAAGAIAAYVANAILYVPLLVVLHLWKRKQEPSRLPPERLMRAIVSGVRYVVNSPPLRIVLNRSFIFSAAGASAPALMPLLARDLLGGSAQTYGIMLGAFGVGAVSAGLNIATLRQRFSEETSVRVSALAMGVALIVVGFSRSPWITLPALVVVGAGWIVSLSLFNIAVQFSAPRWVAGRALAAFRTAQNGGVAAGAWVWGQAADIVGVDKAILLSAAVMLAFPLLTRWQKMHSAGGPNDTPIGSDADPEVRLSLSGRSGPVVIEIEYRVAAEHARAFHQIMQQVQLSRQRSGAYGWSLARELSDPQLWTERYHCPTWHDYLRQRSRSTVIDRALYQSARDLHLGPDAPRLRRMLERPFGSVRWKDETPDHGTDGDGPASTHAAGGL